MRYNTIFNNPHERTRVTYPYITWGGVFLDWEIESIIQYCNNVGVEDGTTFVGKKPKIRKSKVKFHLPNEHTNWIFQRMNGVIQSINERWYGFDLNGYDAFQFTQYDGSKLGKYDWHADIGYWDNLPQEMIEPRKLSLSLLLNDDFEGGEFQFNVGTEAKPGSVNLKKGEIVAFPSWVLHRVTPVTKGIRNSLVIWVTGPKFR